MRFYNFVVVNHWIECDEDCVDLLLFLLTDILHAARTHYVFGTLCRI